ncbi:hypothetical protein LCGC14_3040140 [marine sediment metagenome]|uniref:Uncharacterized protein n=1 Tax=marine sediment metagenome TaxID=412755 RepID=A0A0F8WQG3_9ZZZZ
MTNREKVEQTIHDHFMSIAVRAGYKENGTYNLEKDPETAQVIGNLFFDYMVASVFDTTWEGFTDQDLESIGSLIRDMDVAHKAM